MITRIDNRSLGAAALTLIGQAVERVSRTFSHQNVEKDTDLYRDYFLTGAELVQRSSLASLTLKVLNKDCPFKKDPLYLVTLRALDEGRIQKRQFFVTHEAFSAFGIKTSPQPQSEKDVLSTKAYTLTTLGQYWGTVRPRVQAIVSQPGKQESVDAIKESLKEGGKRVSRLPVARYMAYKK